jgi:hypothetical protein
VEEPDLEDVVRAAFGGVGGMERYSKPASKHGPVEPVRAAGAGDSDHSGSFE